MKTLNLARFRDLVCHMAVNIEDKVPFEIAGKSKKKIALNFSQQRDMFRTLVNNYVFSTGIHVNAFSPALANHLGVGTQKETGIDNSLVLQAFSGTPDLPELTKNVFERTMQMPEIDVAWQLAYRPVPLERGDLEWEIFDVDTGFTFKLVAEGAEARIYGVSGTEQKAEVQLYGAGLGLTWKIIESRKLYAFQQLLERLRAEYYELWADVHYGLLATAANSHTVAWQQGEGNLNNVVVARDAITIDKAYSDINDDLKDKSYGDTANAQMYLYVGPALRSRMENAVGRRGHQDHPNFSDQASPVIPIYTNSSHIPANKGVLVLPGRKIQNGVYLRELAKFYENHRNLDQVTTHFTAFGAIVGESKQCRMVSFS